MSAVQEMLFLFLLALTPGILFPLLFERADALFLREPGLDRQRGYHVVLAVTCAISMIFSSIYTTELFGIIPLSYGMVPLFTAMLYEKFAYSAVLAVLQLVLFTVFQEFWTLSNFLLDTGLLIFPLVLMSRTRFLVLTRTGKSGMLAIFILVGSLLSATSPFYLHKESLANHSSLAFALYSNILLMIVAGIILVYIIEDTLDKHKSRLQVEALSSRYYREEEKMQQMMDAAPLSVVLLDREGRVTMLNQTFLKLLRQTDPGASGRDLLGLPLEPVLESLQIKTKQLQDGLAALIRSQSPVSELVQIQDTTLFTSISPILKRHSDEAIGAVVVVQDITELETLRLELRHVDRLSLVGQMAAGITHEIRNPMAVVRGFLQLMREKSPDSLDHYYRIVLEELDRANGIINDFLSLAQNRPVRKEPTSLDAIIHELTPLLWADANLRGQSIEVKLDEEVPLLELNPKEIKQLILNLCRNGMEAMEDKGLLTLETRKVAAGVELLVSDTGPGIPPNKRENLFQPFFTTKAKGTGLGLALCKSIVERHNGRVSVESEVGVGTTFAVLFPDPGRPN
ncbi:two-component system sensor histidine kinase NtrB [Paenibacillus pinistramenti]|uniref:two-component system sensor histidine kinase NtrB n=1 Tax=Paenibacillus pinistramenti TaxID=1768003 RepID=UPI001107AC5F|nr:ATP-binding protein [Paenibacillus pinistramenti]